MYRLSTNLRVRIELIRCVPPTTPLWILRLHIIIRHITSPGYPANPRMLLTRLYMQLGVFLDYLTGLHEEGGLSVRLRKVMKFDTDETSVLPQKYLPDEDVSIRSLIPPQYLSLFPQFGVTSEWPPTMFVHGTHDTAVPVGESRHLAQKLRDCGVDVEVHEPEGSEHSFDYEPGAEELFGSIFDAAMEFLNRRLGADANVKN